MALEDFSLTVDEGKFVCIVGPSGRGKTTVLREDMGLELEPNACLGMVRVNIVAGVIVTERGAEELNSLATRVQHVR